MSSLFHLIILIILTHFVSIKTCTANLDDLQSCLIENNVYNVSINPSFDPKPRTNTYFELLEFSIQNLRFTDPSIQKPVAIVVPGSKEQLVSSVLCSRAGSWEIRVRSGGHSYEGSSYTVDDGLPFVLIDMMSLDQVSVDLESEVAWVEAGATLGQTYYAISERSGVLGFPAGSCPTVGIGGHIAGGGYGLLSKKYGLAADNVVDALLIDAEGRLLDRDAMGEEVFWAIRGSGGGVMGIIYAWKIKLVKVPETVTVFSISRPGSKHHVLSLIKKWQHVVPKLDDEFYLLVVGAGLPKMTGNIVVSATFKGFYLGSKVDAVSIIEKVFPELCILESDWKEMTWIESVLYFSGMNNGSSVHNLKDRFPQQKNYFKAKVDYIRAPIPERGLASALETLEKEPKGYAMMDPYGGAMHKICSDAIPYPHRKGNLYTIQYGVEWKEEDDAKNKNYMDWVRGLYNIMTPYVSSSPRAAYVNYMDFDLGVMNLSNNSESLINPVERARVWGGKYFLNNYDRLVSAKTLIDPSNVFRKQQGIPPLPRGLGRAQERIDSRIM